MADVAEEAVSKHLELETEVVERSAVIARLEEAEQFEPEDPRMRHGRLYTSTCLTPPGQEAGLWTDDPCVLDRKVKAAIGNNMVGQDLRLLPQVPALRDLLRMSQYTVVYTEAVTEEAPLGHYGSGQCGLSHGQDVKVKECIVLYWTVQDLKVLPGDSLPASYTHLRTMADAGLALAVTV